MSADGGSCTAHGRLASLRRRVGPVHGRAAAPQCVGAVAKAACASARASLIRRRLPESGHRHLRRNIDRSSHAQARGFSRASRADDRLKRDPRGSRRSGGRTHRMLTRGRRGARQSPELKLKCGTSAPEASPTSVSDPRRAAAEYGAGVRARARLRGAMRARRRTGACERG
ncbi:hypothetical protein WOLCODRAFT_155020 [Wolfiporia cocos MD-104 SS10]|uniref:Uncharacterized protein n=1 Tax=Wolfiporia cocos (strain MD-104) TaxID=742152 RepID=A0A2H3K988_WOLCO|nr:hypothetical protein WOLCODRAFT_155020 [Wolfiporia cocos MD-104 SS10]